MDQFERFATPLDEGKIVCVSLDEVPALEDFSREDCSRGWKSGGDLFSDVVKTLEGIKESSIVIPEEREFFWLEMPLALTKWRGLTSVSLLNASMSGFAAFHVCNALRDCPLEHLDMSGNCLGNVDSLRRKEGRHATILTTCISSAFNTLESLVLSDNRINEMSVDALGLPAVSKCQVLRTLDLSKNCFHELDDESISRMWSHIGSCTSLQTLSMADMGPAWGQFNNSGHSDSQDHAATILELFGKLVLRKCVLLTNIELDCYRWQSKIPISVFPLYNAELFISTKNDLSCCMERIIAAEDDQPDIDRVRFIDPCNLSRYSGDQQGWECFWQSLSVHPTFKDATAIYFNEALDPPCIPALIQILLKKSESLAFPLCQLIHFRESMYHCINDENAYGMHMKQSMVGIHKTRNAFFNDNGHCFKDRPSFRFKFAKNFKGIKLPIELLTGAVVSDDITQDTDKTQKCNFEMQGFRGLLTDGDGEEDSLYVDRKLRSKYEGTWLAWKEFWIFMCTQFCDRVNLRLNRNVLSEDCLRGLAAVMQESSKHKTLAKFKFVSIRDCILPGKDDNLTRDAHFYGMASLLQGLTEAGSCVRLDLRNCGFEDRNPKVTNRRVCHALLLLRPLRPLEELKLTDYHDEYGLVLEDIYWILHEMSRSGTAWNKEKENIEGSLRVFAAIMGFKRTHHQVTGIWDDVERRLRSVFRMRRRESGRLRSEENRWWMRWRAMHTTAEGGKWKKCQPFRANGSFKGSHLAMFLIRSFLFVADMITDYLSVYTLFRAGQSVEGGILFGLLCLPAIMTPLEEQKLSGTDAKDLFNALLHMIFHLIPVIPLLNIFKSFYNTMEQPDLTREMSRQSVYEAIPQGWLQAYIFMSQISALCAACPNTCSSEVTFTAISREFGIGGVQSTDHGLCISNNADIIQVQPVLLLSACISIINSAWQIGEWSTDKQRAQADAAECILTCKQAHATSFDDEQKSESVCSHSWLKAKGITLIRACSFCFEALGRALISVFFGMIISEGSAAVLQIFGCCLIVIWIFITRWILAGFFREHTCLKHLNCLSKPSSRVQQFRFVNSRRSNESLFCALPSLETVTCYFSSVASSWFCNLNNTQSTVCWAFEIIESALFLALFRQTYPDHFGGLFEVDLQPQSPHGVASMLMLLSMFGQIVGLMLKLLVLTRGSIEQHEQQMENV